MEHHRFNGSFALVRLVVPPLCHHKAVTASRSQPACFYIAIGATLRTRRACFSVLVDYFGDFIQGIS